MSKRPVSCWSWKRSGVLFCCPPRKVTVRPQVSPSSQSDHVVTLLTVRPRCHHPHSQTTLSSSSRSDHFVILLTVRLLCPPPHSQTTLSSSSQSDHFVILLTVRPLCHPPHSQTTLSSSSQSDHSAILLTVKHTLAIILTVRPRLPSSSQVQCTALLK